MSLNKGKPENSFNIAKNQEFELITSCQFKNLISPKPTWNFKKIRAIASITSQTSSIFQIIFITKSFFRKSSKPGHGNLVLITSTVQVEL